MANNTTVDGLLDLHASGSFVVMSDTFNDGKIVWDHSEQAARGVADSHRISDSVRNRVIEAPEMGPRSVNPFATGFAATLSQGETGTD